MSRLSRLSRLSTLSLGRPAWRASPTPLSPLAHSRRLDSDHFAGRQALLSLQDAFLNRPLLGRDADRLVGQGVGWGHSGFGRLGVLHAVSLTVLRLGRLNGDGFVTALCGNPVPQGEVARELAAVVLEFGVGLVGSALGRHGSVAHILHTQGRGDDQDLVQCTAGFGLQDHAPNPGVQGQFGQLCPQRGEFVLVVHRSELVEELVAVGDGFGARGLQKGKALHIPQVQRLHAQDHPSQGAAQNLGVGEGCTRSKVLLIKESNANAIGHPPAATCPLRCRGLGDGLHQQLLDLAAKAVALDPRESRVNHIPNPRHGE